METPLKSTRRRLRKVLKKSKTNLCLNVNSLYQKKLKSAINVSLNSSLTVRTLQTNNRSLASSLEKMRQDFRQAHEHYTRLLEENHLLRERILELQRIDASERFIEEEVNRRIEHRMKDVEKSLSSLYGHTRGILNNLTELSDVCKSKSVTEDGFSSSTESSNHNYTMLSHVRPDLSLDDTLDVEPAPSGYSPALDGEQDDFDKEVAHISDNMNEMTVIMEQSVVYPSGESSSSMCTKLDTVSEIPVTTTPVTGKQKITKLPMRIPMCSIRARKSIGNQTAGNIVESLQKVSRRQTFIIATNESEDSALLTNMKMPPLLSSDCFVESGMLYLESQDPVSTPTSPKKRPLKEKSPKKVKPSKETYIALEEPQGKKFQNEGDRSLIKISPKAQRQSPAGMKNRKLSLSGRVSRSQSRRTSPKKITSSPTPQAEKQPAKGGDVDQKSATRTKKKKNPGSPKFSKVSPKHSLRKKNNLFISNEFSLLNSLIQKAETTHHESSGTIIQHCHSHEKGERTIFPADDMELTKMEGQAHNELTKHVPEITDCNKKINDDFYSLLQKVCSRSKERVQTAIETEVAGDEKVPDAVTTRVTKPGKFTFAASRKESDGTRKNVPVSVPKARSKSKKQLADMIDKLPDTIPQSIFDFHEKTPGYLNSEKPASSVYNISADESSLSPLIPINKNRSQNRMSHMSSEVSATSVPHSEYIGPSKVTDMFYVGQTFEEPVKEGSPPAKSIYRTRSRSRGRKLYDSESERAEAGTRSSSRKRSTNPKMESQLQSVKTTSSEATSDEILTSTNQTSSETANQRSGQGSSTELTSMDSKFDDFMASHLNSDDLTEQTEGCHKILESDNTSAGKKVSSSKYSSVLAETKRLVSEMYRNKHGDKDILVSSDASHVPLVLETNNQTMEKGVDILESAADHLKTVNGIFQEGDLKCQAATVASNTKLQDTNNMISGSDEILASCENSKTSVNQSKSLEMLNADTSASDTIRGKNPRSRSTVKKVNQNSTSLPKAPPKDDDLEDISSEAGNFICTRKNRTKGKKEIKCPEELAVSSDSKGMHIFIDDVAADGDVASRTKFTQVKEVCDEAGTDLLLEKLKHLKSPVLSYSEEQIHSEASTPSNTKETTSQKISHGPRISRIVKGLPSDKQVSATKRTASASSPDRLTGADGKRRRAATKVNYAEVALNLKLRRGDPHTSHYCTAEKIAIYKSPKVKAKKKVGHRQILGNLQNLSIKEEQGMPSEVQ